MLVLNYPMPLRRILYQRIVRNRNRMVFPKLKNKKVSWNLIVNNVLVCVCGCEL